MISKVFLTRKILRPITRKIFRANGMRVPAAASAPQTSGRDGWRQEPGTPVYGTPYGSFDDEKGTPAGERVIRAALAAATRP
jgi:hypothetical protein